MAKWMHSRLWGGTFPSYHLVNQEEVVQEKQISELYFRSCRFADLRMQIRLNLKELPLDFQLPTKGKMKVFWETLELFDEYLPLILSIQRYHSVRRSQGSTLPYLLSTFPPLFYGLGGLSLIADRLVGKQKLAQFCIPIELALVLCTIGQLHALHATKQMEQEEENLTPASWPRIQHAEQSWQSAESFLQWAESFSRQMTRGIDPNDSLTRAIWQFFEAIAAIAASLSSLCFIHRISTHLTGLSLTEIKPERFSRIGSICSRRAVTLLRKANSSLPDLKENGYYEQLKWCLRAYEIRWVAMFYQYEMSIYNLDANSEIAIYYCDILLRLRMPHLLAGSEHPTFSRFAHDIQLLHHTHLTNVLDQKKAFLNACRERFGPTWALVTLDKHAGAELFSIREVERIFSEEQQSEDIVAEEEEINYASPFLVEIIATNVQEVILQANGSPTSLDLEIQVPDNPDALHERTAKNVLNRCPSKPLYTTPASTSENVVYSATDKSDKAHSTLKPEPPKQRPSSASPQGSGWVTMSYGGKLLHFEKSVDLRQSDTGVSYERSEEALADANHSIVRQSKPRPSSSPCYLSSKKMTKAHDHNSSSSRRHLNNIKMWAPTRAPCALCERRFMRTSLPGVVVMKRIYDLRRKWGVIQDSKKYNAPSALYGTANVCLLCQEILAYEESKKPTDENVFEDQQLHKRGSMSDLAASRSNNSEKENEIARMIHDSIMYRWHQEPLMHRVEDNNLQDIAVNKRVRQSSTVCSMKAQNALHSDTNRAAHTKEEFQPWWEIDLANYVEVHSVKVYLRDEVSHLYAAAAANPGRHTTGVYPLHISISMKTGVGRDCDDIITSCVSSLCVTEKMGPPIEWVAPQRSRGRFVRIQCEGRAILHIERVHVYVAKPEPKAANDPVVRRQHFRQKLQRAAFCASVIATTATPVAGSAKVAAASEPTPKRRMSTLTTRSAQRRGSQPTLARNESLLASALFFDPERAEKRRISRLYARFKSLLDARVKYIAPEVETDDEENGGDSGPNEKQTLAESK